MCRLLGYATSAPTTLATLLGEADLAEFTELSVKHGDGWGTARAAAGGAVEVEKAPDSARRSEHFRQVAHARPADLAMVHLRWATLGLPVVARNAHPFTDGRLAFAHNGSIAPPSALDPLLTDRARQQRQGDTDSERFFLAVLSRLPEGELADDQVARAYADTVRSITQTVPLRSLNSMLLSPTQLHAVCCFDPGAQEREAEPDYYRLRYRTAPGSVLVSSSGWGSGWAELGNGQMLTIDRATLATTVRALEPAAAAS